MRQIPFIFLLPFLFSCSSRNDPEKKQSATAFEIPAKSGDIPLPPGYHRSRVTAGSFGAWLRQLPLKKDKTVYLFNGEKKANQTAQFAVVKISTGKKDLQQCADAMMRLRAEYLFATGQYGAIAFTDYAGKTYAWKGGKDRVAFQHYLEQVFSWCGSASLEKQLKPVNAFEDISIGDVLIRGGFPGHAVMVIDLAENEKGEKVYLLLQSYQPAQDMHILLNPVDKGLSPWYQVGADSIIYTPEWHFTRHQLRRW